MDNSDAHGRAKEYLHYLEDLVTKWEHATDPESVWILGLLRTDAERVRQVLAAADPPRPSDMGANTAAETLWKMYLREIRPLLWRKAELYALARPYPSHSEGGPTIPRSGLPPSIQQEIDKIDADIGEIRRQYRFGQ